MPVEELEKNVGPICPSCYNYSWLRYCDGYKQASKFKTIQQCPMETHDGSNTLCKCMKGVQCSNVPMVSKSGHNRTRMDTIWKSCGFDGEVFSYGAVLKKEKLAIFCDNFFLQQFHMAEPTHIPWHPSCKRQNSKKNVQLDKVTMAWTTTKTTAQSKYERYGVGQIWFGSVTSNKPNFFWAPKNFYKSSALYF